MYHDLFVQFICANWDVVKRWALHKTLSVFFLLVNFYHKYLLSLDECSIVDRYTFTSSFAEPSCDNHSTKSPYNGTILYRKEHQKIAVLLGKDNVALTERQKSVVLEFCNLEKGRDTATPSLHIFVCRDNKCSAIICECCVPLLTKFLGFFAKNTWENPTDKLNHILECNNLVKEYMDRSKGGISSTPCEEEFVSLEDLSIAASFFLLYINPYSSENCRNLRFSVSTMNRRNLLNCTLFVNNLLKLYPKEVELWNIKCCIISRWFSKYSARLKLCKFTSGFAKILKCSKSQAFSLHLKFIISRFLSDDLLKLESGFSSRILSIKPFNISLTNYLNNVYSCICKYICVKLVRNLADNHPVLYPRNDHLKRFRFINTRIKYCIFLSKVIDSYFIKLYYDILREYSFPGLFLLLLGIVSNRKYDRIHPRLEISSISSVESCFNEDMIFLLKFCDQMIKYDVHNCWIYNKSNVLLTILRRFGTCKNVDINEKVYVLNVVFRLSFVFSQHLSTWRSFIPVCDIISSFPTSASKRILLRQVTNTRRKRFRHKGRYNLEEVNYWKSEATFIKNAIEKYGPTETNLDTHHEFSTNGRKKYRGTERNGIFDAKSIFEHFSIAQMDKILQAYRQLFLILINVFQQLIAVDVCHYSLVSYLGPLPKTLLMLRKYLKLTSSDKSVHFISGFVEYMEKFKRMICYKYSMPKGSVARELDVVYISMNGKELVTISMILLSLSCRFYLQWDKSSHLTLEVICKLVLKLIKR